MIIGPLLDQNDCNHSYFEGQNMSVLQPNLYASTSDAIAIAVAVAVLADAARKDFPSVEAQLKAAGFGITGYEPVQGTPDLDACVASDIGAVIKGRGIYQGAWQPRRNGAIVHAYADTDLLKDASGQQMLLTWYAARDELARRNGGRRYGDGTEAALSAALSKSSGTEGAYKDGDLVMGPQVLLNGRNVDGDKVRAQNTFDLLSGSKGDALKNISKTLRDARSDAGRWSWSCSKDRDYSSTAWAVRLSDGYADWISKGSYRLGVLPFRFFREPHAVKAVSHLNI
jgi:hypothetical protein